MIADDTSVRQRRAFQEKNQPNKPAAVTATLAHLFQLPLSRRARPHLYDVMTASSRLMAYSMPVITASWPS
jgi:hypothetical protein